MARDDDPPRTEATVLTGITALMNPAHMKTGITPKELQSAENHVMGHHRIDAVRRQEVDHAAEFAKQMERYAASIGVSLDAPGAPPPSGAGGKAGGKAGGEARGGKAGGTARGGLGPMAAPDFDAFGDAVGSSESSSGTDSDSGSSSGSGTDSGASSGSGTSTSEGSGSESGSGSSSGSGSGSESSSSGGSRRHASRREARSRAAGADIDRLLKELEQGGKPSKSSRRSGRRHESPPRAHRHGGSRWQERQRHIDSAISALQGGAPAMQEGASVREAKMAKISEITALRSLLIEEGHECSEVTVPTMENSMSEIDYVLQILHLKNERNRFSTLAEELIVGAAEVLETVLDGQTPIPLLGWKPDYTGYHAVVATKLHRARFETSSIVGDAVRSWNMGPGTRLLMELLPGILLYPRQQRRERGYSQGLLADPALADASQAILRLNQISAEPSGTTKR